MLHHFKLIFQKLSASFASSSSLSSLSVIISVYCWRTQKKLSLKAMAMGSRRRDDGGRIGPAGASR
jgi:hypothetical protein